MFSSCIIFLQGLYYKRCASSMMGKTGKYMNGFLFPSSPIPKFKKIKQQNRRKKTCNLAVNICNRSIKKLINPIG